MKIIMNYIFNIILFFAGVTSFMYLFELYEWKTTLHLFITILFVVKMEQWSKS